MFLHNKLELTTNTTVAINTENNELSRGKKHAGKYANKLNMFLNNLI